MTTSILDLLGVLADGQVMQRSGATVVGVKASNVSDGDGAPVSTPASVGDVYVDTTNLAVYKAVGVVDSGDWSLMADSASHAGIEVGSGAPVDAPAKLGNVYIDTTNKVGYLATGTSVVGDWSSAAPGTITIPRFDEITLADTFTDVAGGQGIASAWKVPTNGNAKVLVKTELWCDTAPANGQILGDWHKNGVTVYTGGTGRPAIAQSATSGISGTPAVTALADGDLLQLQIDEQHASDQGNCGRLFGRIYWTETVAI